MDKFTAARAVLAPKRRVNADTVITVSVTSTTDRLTAAPHVKSRMVETLGTIFE
jgi:hypothetical protein